MRTDDSLVQKMKSEIEDLSRDRGHGVTENGHQHSTSAQHDGQNGQVSCCK
jgi:hypothetical protein